MIIPKWIFFLLSCYFLIPIRLSSQIDLKIGYEGSWQESVALNDILQRHTEERPWLNHRFDSYSFLNGFAGGIRYVPFSFWGFEVNYTYQYKNSSVSGTNPDNEASYFAKMILRSNTYSIGTEFIIGKFVFGGTADRYAHRYLLESPERSDLHILSKINGMSSQFFLAYDIPAGDYSRIRIKPFLQYFWDQPDLFELDQGLNPNTPAYTHPSDYLSEPFRLGLQVVIYNGTGSRE